MVLLELVRQKNDCDRKSRSTADTTSKLKLASLV
jgi:hypothetical protein